MSRRRFELAAITVCLLGGLSPGRAAVPLRWAADAEGGAPYIFKNPQNPDENIGFEVDLAKALGKELGRSIEFKQYDFKSLYLGLERGDFDLAMNGLEVTSRSKKLARLSRPYYIYRLQLVVRADETRFNSLEGVKAGGGTVATLEDTAASRLLARMGIEQKIYEGQVEPYQVLAERREGVDAVLLDAMIADAYAKKNPKLKYVGAPLARGYYAIALRKDHEALAQQVDAALDRLIQNGELRRIYEKWDIWNEEQNQLSRASIDDIGDDADEGYSFSGAFRVLVRGAWLTVQISVLGFLLAMGLGLPIALGRLYGPAPVRWLTVGYIEFFRGIPILLLLVFLYYGLPRLSPALDLNAFQAAVIGFGLNYAAYEAEIYRAGIDAVPPGQGEAAAALGMPTPLTFRRIILPQATRSILPPMTNDFVALFKDTSIVSIIALEELSKKYQILAKSSGDYLTIGLTTAALYLIMSVPLGYLSRYLEERWGKHE